MAAFIRACGYRLNFSRCQITSSIVAKNVTRLFQDLGFPCGISRLSTYVPSNSGIGRQHDDHSVTAKVLTDKDVHVHNNICSKLVGKKGNQIKRFIFNTGLNFKVIAYEGCDHLFVCGSNVEEVKRAAEKVTQEVKRLRNWVQTERVSAKVFTDEDVDVHNSICKSFIGIGGQKIKSFLGKTELDFGIDTKEAGCIIVYGSEADLKSAEEKVKQEVERIKSDIQRRFSETVPTDKDNNVHAKICRILIGKGGENIKRLLSETGVKFEIYTKRDDHLVVSGTPEAVKIAVEKVTQEVEKIRNHLQRQTAVTEKVLTDKDEYVHKSIFSTILGRKGYNIKHLKLDTGVNITDKYDAEEGEHALIISGTNDEVVKNAVEKLTQEVERVKKTLQNSVSKKVFTHGNVNVHEEIFAQIVGKAGVNIDRLRQETGLDFNLHIKKGEQAIYVVGADTEVVVSAVEKVTQEVERIHIYRRKPVIMKVPTHKSVAFHHRICRKLIGTKGRNIKRFILENGLQVELDITDKDHLLVSGTDVEVVRLAVDKVKQEVERIIHYFQNQVTETVFTDEDFSVHKMIRNMFIGTEGENIKRFLSETGLNVEITTHKVGHFLVTGTDSEEVISAAEKIANEIKRIKNDIDLEQQRSGTAKVFKDEDINVHIPGYYD